MRVYGGTSRRTPRTLIVLNLLQVLGLCPLRGQWMWFSACNEVLADEVLWVRQYVAESLSAHGWL